MELRQYLSTIIKWWWLIVASILVAAAASYFSTKAIPNTYESRTTLMIGQALQNLNPDVNQLSTGEALGQSYADLVRREPIMAATISALGLPWDVGTLQGMVSSRSVPNTQLLEISVIDTDPQRAQVLANEVAQQLILKSPSNTNPQLRGEQQFAAAQMDDLKKKISDSQAQMRELDDNIAKANSARQIDDFRSRKTALESQVGLWQQTYSNMLLTLQNGAPNSLSVVEPAKLPYAPVGPNVTSNVTLAALIGLVLASGAAFLLEYIDDRVKSPDIVRKYLNLDSLGSISYFSRRDYPNKMLVTAYPRSPIAESYRVVRTNLQFSSIDKSLQTLVVTSSQPLEGKSFTSANLAGIIAQSGKKVILVDADLRRPTIHGFFNLSNNIGLTSVLLGNVSDPLKAVQSVGSENLGVILTGPLPPNPSELLGSKRMRDVIAALKQAADIVIFDTPPSLTVTDATILAAEVDGVIVVIDASTTRPSMAQHTVQALNAVGAHIVGVVLNKIKAEDYGPFGYSYGGYYYYGKQGPPVSVVSRLASIIHRNGNSRKEQSVPVQDVQVTK